MSFIKQHLQKCLDDGIPDMSLWNCHAPGIHSIAIKRIEENGKKVAFNRIFYADHAIHSLDALIHNQNFNIAVHNHRYNIVLEPLVGILGNYTIQKVGGTKKAISNLYEFAYDSGLTGSGELQFLAKYQYWTEKTQFLDSKKYEAVHMQAEELHTVIVPKIGEFSAWLVVEMNDRIDSRFYSLKRKPNLDFSELYQHMSISDAENYLEKIIGGMK